MDSNTNCIYSPTQITVEDGVVEIEATSNIKFRFGNQIITAQELYERHTSFEGTISSVRSEMASAISSLASDVSMKQGALSTSLSSIIADAIDSSEGIDESLASELMSVEMEKADESDVVDLSSSLMAAESSINSIEGSLSSQDSLAQSLSGSLSSAGDTISDLGDSFTDLSSAVAYADDVDATAAQLEKEISTLKSAQEVTESNLDNLVFSVKVQSKGACDGNKRLAWFNGVAYQWKTSWSRGINVIKLHPVTLHPVEDKNFDTCCRSDTAQEVAKMKVYLDSQTVGTTLIFVIFDEGVNSIDDDLIAKIEEYGSQFIRTIEYRESWAMIGVKGAAIGSVPEDHGGTGSTPNCGGGGRATKVIEQTYFAGKLNPFNSELTNRILRESTTIDGGFHRQGSWDGFVLGPGNYPTCSDRYGIAEIGKIFRGTYLRYIDIKVYGSHRGYHPSHYYDYKHFVIMCGDKCTSHTLESRGRNLAQLWDTIHGGTGDYGGNGDIDIPSDGYTVAVYIPSVCGANFDHSIVVSFYSFEGFHSSFQPTNHRCFNMRGNNNIGYPYARFKCWDV
eukprot:m.125145 g.125145  ORF g.125145 m.125145 type:complete len:564 (-) comp12974_c0_seq9:188-1879(-)